MIIIIITLIDYTSNGALQGQYKQIDINVVNKHDDNVLNIPTDQLAIYKVQPRSWIFSNQEQVQWVAGWRAWTPNYKTSALTTQLHFFPYMYGSIVVYFVWYGCLSWHTIFFFFREYFLETLNTCGYNYQVHTGILILYNDKLTSRVLIHLQS